MKTRIQATIATLMLACAMTANGQAAPDGGGGGPGPDGGGPPNMSQMREMQMTRLQTQLDMPDDAFAAVKPQLEKVMDLKRDEGGGMGGRPGGPGGPGGGMGGPGGMRPDAQGGGQGGGQGGPPDQNGGGPGGPGGGGPDMGGGPGGGDQQPQSEVRKAQRDLRTAVRDTSTDNDSLKAKMQAYRDAKTKNHANLLAAETQLKSVLTLRQEAVLLSMGVLD